MGLVARGGVHGSGLWETAVVGEEVACAVWSRLAKAGRKRPNKRTAGKWGRWRCTGGTRVRHRL